MNGSRSLSWRFAALAMVLVLEVFHLLWEYFHGGVASHHLLNQAAMPAISNYWGLILLPSLTWFVTGRVGHQLFREAQRGDTPAKTVKNVVIAFLAPMLVGGMLSLAFTHGFNDLASYIFIGMFVVGLLLPVFRVECILGFVLGMTFTFGAVLPLLVASAIAMISAIAHRAIYPVARWSWRRIAGFATQKG